MVRLFTLLTLMAISYNSIGQGFRQKKIKLPLTFKYSYVKTDNDTVKCKRASSGLKKLQYVKGLDFLILIQITSRIINIESVLDGEKKGGSEWPNNSFAGIIKQLKIILEENRVDLDLTEYENEFAFYQRHPVKSKEKLEKEAAEKKRMEEEITKKERLVKLDKGKEKRRKLIDSLTVLAIRENEIKDSVEEVSRKIEQQRLRQQSIAYHKKLEEQEKIEKEEFERQQKARRQFLTQEYGLDDGELIFNRKVKIGWIKEKCLESWGKPKEINRTTTLNIVHEQWVYTLKKYLYFDNGVLTAIQD